MLLPWDSEAAAASADPRERMKLKVRNTGDVVTHAPVLTDTLTHRGGSCRKSQPDVCPCSCIC